MFINLISVNVALNGILYAVIGKVIFFVIVYASFYCTYTVYLSIKNHVYTISPSINKNKHVYNILIALRIHTSVYCR